MLDFRIETFLSVCRHMNFTEAAAELHLTQPAVSQHIRWLEQRYAAQLFRRDGKRVRLAPAGEVLLSAMTVLRNDETALTERIRTCETGRRVLTFGVTLTIGEYALVQPLSRYLKHRPELDLRMRFANTTALLEAVQSGEVEFALVEGYIPPNSFETLRYCREPYIAVCAAQHAFVQEVHTLEDLLSERLLARERGSGTRDILERSLAVHGRTTGDFSHVIELENMHTIVQLLCADCGIAFLYRAAVAEELEKGTLREIPLSDLSLSHDFTFLWNKGSVFSSEYRAFCRALQSERLAGSDAF